MRMNRIVITGATSMIGAALVRECLASDVEVVAVIQTGSSKKDRLPEHEKLRIAECRLEELQELPQRIRQLYTDPAGTPVFDTFYHIAWGSTGANRDKSTELQSKNIFYTLEAVKAAKALGCTRFIGAGSQAEYGPCEQPVIGPDTPTRPVTPYGVSKLAAGALSRLLCKELSMEWIWPRIFSVYGIYEKENTMVSTALRTFLRGESGVFTPGEQIWDYLYSKDAGRACYLMGEKGRAGSVYCVGSGQGRPLKQYIQEMHRLAAPGKTTPGIGKKPYPAGKLTNLCADIRTLTEDTGFVPEYSFEDGILETIAWMDPEADGASITGR